VTCHVNFFASVVMNARAVIMGKSGRNLLGKLHVVVVVVVGFFFFLYTVYVSSNACNLELYIWIQGRSGEEAILRNEEL
jgi:hypothetical protein